MSAPTIAAIQRATAAHFCIPLDRLLGSRRSRCWARPRQVAMYLACELTGKSLSQIGRAFYRDHTTVYHARELIPMLAARDERLAWKIGAIRQQLTDDQRQERLPFAA